jgi:hypothetical protein
MKNLNKYVSIGLSIRNYFPRGHTISWDNLRDGIQEQFGTQNWPALAQFLIKYKYIEDTYQETQSSIPESKSRKVKVYRVL